LICFLIHVWWPEPRSPASQMPLKSDKPRHKRSKEPNRSRDISINRCAKRASKGSIYVPIPPARHRR
jgi:hypothetical protein